MLIHYYWSRRVRHSPSYCYKCTPSSSCCFAGRKIDEPLVLFGDIAVPTGLQNADPCTARGCLWPKSSDGNVYIPYIIANQYCKFQPAVFMVCGQSRESRLKTGNKSMWIRGIRNNSAPSWQSWQYNNSSSGHSMTNNCDYSSVCNGSSDSSQRK